MIKRTSTTRLELEHTYHHSPGVERHNWVNVRHGFGVFYNQTTCTVDRPLIETSVEYGYESGRSKSCFAATELTPAECRELATFLNQMAVTAENAAKDAA